jgi:uncharacterized membrane protein (DUF106 family)
MDLLAVKTWAIFYLLSFVTLLWAAFLSSQGQMLGIGFVLDVVVVGVNCAIVMTEVKRHVTKKERMRQLLAMTSATKKPTEHAR